MLLIYMFENKAAESIFLFDLDEEHKLFIEEIEGFQMFLPKDNPVAFRRFKKYIKDKGTFHRESKSVKAHHSLKVKDFKDIEMFVLALGIGREG